MFDGIAAGERSLAGQNRPNDARLNFVNNRGPVNAYGHRVSGQARCPGARKRVDFACT